MLRTVFVFAILVPGLVMAFVRPYRALLLYLWFAFFRPDQWVWIDLTSFRLSFFLGVVLVANSLIRGIWPNVSHPLSIATLAFLGTCLLSNLTAFYSPWTREWTEFFFNLVVVCLLTVNIVRTPQQLVGTLAVVACSLGFHSAKAGLASVLAGGLHFSAGLFGAFSDNNGYALAIVMVIPLLIGTAQNADLLFKGLVPPWMIGRLRLGLYLLAPLSAFAVFSTFSRGGFLALCCMVFAMLVLNRKPIRWAVGLVVATIIVLLVVPLPDGYTDRLSSIDPGIIFSPTDTEDLVEVEDRSAAGRLYFWGVAVDMASDRMFGVGVRGYGPAYNFYDTSRGEFGRDRAVHSSHFQVLAGQGYPGFVVWVTVFVVATIIAFRTRRFSRTPGLDPTLARLFYTVPNALLGSMVGFIVGGSFISLALNDLTWITFALIAVTDMLTRTVAVESGNDQPEIQKHEPVIVHSRVARRATDAMARRNAERA